MTRFWIRVNARLADDADVRGFALAILPKLAPWQAVGLACGLLVTLWGRVVDEQENGDVSGRDDDVLEAWANWRGKRGVFATAFRSAFTDGGKIREWTEYQGKLIERREKDRVRKIRRNSAGTSTGIPQETPQEVGGNSAGIPCINEDDHVHENISSSPLDDIARLLEGLPPTQRISWEAEIRAAEQGMHGKPLTAEQIGRACRDYVGNGHLDKPNMRHFRAYLVSAGRLQTIRPIGAATSRPSKQEAGRARLQTWLDDTAPAPTGATNGE